MRRGRWTRTARPASRRLWSAQFAALREMLKGRKPWERRFQRPVAEPLSKSPNISSTGIDKQALVWYNRPAIALPFCKGSKLRRKSQR